MTIPGSRSPAPRRTTWWSARACWRELPPLLGRRRARRCRPPAVLHGDSAEPVCATTLDRPGQVLLSRCPTARTRKTLAVAGSCWDASRPGGLHPLRRRGRSRRGSDHRSRPGGSPPRGCAACGSCRCRPRCPAWSTRRWAARPASTPPRQEPGRRVPPAGRGAVRSRPCSPRCRPPTTSRGLAEVVKCGFIADPAILDLIEADPAARGPARPPSSASWWSARCGSRPRWSARTSPSRAGARSSTTATPSATPSSAPSGYRRRHGEAVVGRAGVRRRARPPAGRLDAATARPAPQPPRRPRAAHRLRVRTPSPSCSTRCASTRRRAADRLRFVVLDGLARPGIARRPGSRGARRGV